MYIFSCNHLSSLIGVIRYFMSTCEIQNCIKFPKRNFLPLFLMHTIFRDNTLFSISSISHSFTNKITPHKTFNPPTNKQSKNFIQNGKSNTRRQQDHQRPNSTTTLLHRTLPIYAHINFDNAYKNKLRTNIYPISLSADSKWFLRTGFSLSQTSNGTTTGGRAESRRRCETDNQNGRNVEATAHNDNVV